LPHHPVEVLDDPRAVARTDDIDREAAYLEGDMP
jgi:hypothetical protein